MLRALTVGALFVVASGCGPVRAGSLLIDAAAELSAATTAAADEKSPYEYWAADSYLHKAREDHSYANFESAEDFARKSRDCARLARVRAEMVTRTDRGATAVELPAGVVWRPGSAAAIAPVAPSGKQAAEPSDPTPRRDPPTRVSAPVDVEPPPPEGDEPLPPGDEDER